MKMKTFVLLGLVVLCLGGQSYAYAPHTYSISQLGPDMSTNVKSIALDAAGTGLLVGEGGNSASIVLNSLDIATGTLSPYLDLWTSPDFAEVTIRDIDVDPTTGGLAVLLWRNEGPQSAKLLQLYDSALNLENTWNVSGRNGVAWGPDGKVYVAGEGGPNLYEVDPSDGSEISHTVGANLLDVTLDSNGKLLLPQYGKINIFDPDTDTVSMWVNGRDVSGAPENWYAPNLMTPGGEIEDIAIGPDGRVIANQRNHSKFHIFKPDGTGPVIQVEDLSSQFSNNNERKMATDAAGNIYMVHSTNNAATGNNAGVYKFTATIPPGPACDLNGDSSCDIADLDSLAGSGATAISDWLAGAATENGHGSAYLASDSDLDRDVDLTDYNALAGNFDPTGSGATFSQGDGNGDGKVDLSDYNTLSGEFVPTGYTGAAAVPEPSSMVLCMLGLVFGGGIAFCRKRLWS